MSKTRNERRRRRRVALEWALFITCGLAAISSNTWVAVLL